MRAYWEHRICRTVRYWTIFQCTVTWKLKRKLLTCSLKFDCSNSLEDIHKGLSVTEINGGGFIFNKTGEETVLAGVSYLHDGHSDVITWNCFVEGNLTGPLPWDNWNLSLEGDKDWQRKIGFVKEEKQWGFYAGQINSWCDLWMQLKIDREYFIFMSFWTKVWLEQKRSLRGAWPVRITLNYPSKRWKEVDWFQTAQDKVQCRDFVNSVMNIRVP